MQRTFTTMAGRGFEKHCTLSTAQKTVAKLVFEICVARLRQCQWNISQKPGYAHGHSPPA